MKKVSIAFLIFAGFLLLQSCNGSETTTTKDTTPSTPTITDSSNTTRTGNDSSHNMNAGNDSTHNNMNTAAMVDKDANDFVMKAASGGMMEVELGKVAEQNGASQKVKDFGKMMVQDHTNADNELKGIASSKNITVPADMMPMHKMHVDELSKKSGAEFDKAYTKMMVEDHNEDISDFKKASSGLKDADIKGFAAKTLPVLQKHLDAAKKLK